MSDINDHQFKSPDDDRVMNKLYTDCVFNTIQVYCHEIKELTVKVAKHICSCNPLKQGVSGAIRQGKVC